MKKTLALALLTLALPVLSAAAVEPPDLSTPAALQPAPAPAVQQQQPDLAVVLGVPAPRQVSLCSDICVSDFKICRDSCHTLACYFQCRDAYDECVAGC
ncbi:MAG TPA: hypothetical protein VGX68_21110 [Thermoanaerobaculia bacterium]|jgi:hypothetical protein|nr:hypothetical protein [Thermoanaerobaculia bacterium]